MPERNRVGKIAYASSLDFCRICTLKDCINVGIGLTIGMDVSKADVLSRDLLREALEDLGLKSAEVAVYQSALKLASPPASSLARVSGINRAQIYGILSSLKEKGFVEEVTKNKIKYFTPLPVERVVEKLDLMVKRIDVSKRRLENVIPELQPFPNRLSGCPYIQFVQGSGGIERVWEDAVRVPNIEIFAFLDPMNSILIGIHSNKKWRRSYSRRLKSQSVNLRAIVTGTPQDLVTQGKSDTGCELRFQSQLQFGSDILIFGNQVAILTLRPSPRGIVLEGTSFILGFRSLHQLAWGFAASINGQQIDNLRSGNQG